MSLHIVILAAGQGKRMYSNTPKVLHCIGGKPMLQRVIDTASQLNPEMIHIIYGHGGETIKNHLDNLPVNWIEQKQQLGTGHALLQGLPHIPDTSQVLVLYADVPLINAETLALLLKKSQSSLALLIANLANPSGLGRIVRDSNNAIIAIVEEKDASFEQRLINEIYSGICATKAVNLQRWLPMLSNNNAQGEYYLTDVIKFAREENYAIDSVSVANLMEIQGVNNCLQLQQLERALQQQTAEQLMLAGVNLADANRIDVRGELICGKDVFIDVNCIFVGKVILGDGCKIAANCILTNVSLGDYCEILANSILEEAKIANNCQIGPFARLRPGTHLSAHCKIGNFVEIKNATFDEYSKASHLSYIGDASLGKNVNLGAGTITCNYDGVNKHQTTIGNNVFIGSDTQLVAPIIVGDNATVGAGSTLRRDVPPDQLTLTETKQKTISGWKRPVKVLVG